MEHACEMMSFFMIYDEYSTKRGMCVLPYAHVCVERPTALDRTFAPPQNGHWGRAAALRAQAAPSMCEVGRRHGALPRAAASAVDVAVPAAGLLAGNSVAAAAAGDEVLEAVEPCRAAAGVC